MIAVTILFNLVVILVSTLRQIKEAVMKFIRRVKRVRKDIYR